MTCSFPLRYLRVSLLAGLGAALLTGCGSSTTDNSASGPDSQIAVTTAAPKRQAFHDVIKAWGSAVGDPRHARSISLAHAGQVAELKVAAGETVVRGQALLTVTPDPAARSAFAQAQSAFQLASSELKRVEQLAAQRLATQSQLASARKNLADARAARDAQLALGGGSTQESLTAPSDGVVTALKVGLGERFAAGAPLLAFTPAHALVAQLGVQPQDGAKLRAGMTVRLQGVYGEQTSFIGKLDMIGQAIDPQTRLLPAKVELPAEASAALVAGAPLTAEIRTDAFSAWAVPRAAVLHDGHGDYLFQIAKGHAKRIAVTLRSPHGDPVGVLGALDAQAPVIVLGVYELKDGDAVKESAQ